MLTTHALEVTGPTAETVDVCELLLRELDVHPALVELLLNERHGTGVVSIRQGDLSQRFRGQG